MTICLSYTFKHDSKEICNTAAERINVSVRGAERVRLYRCVGFRNSSRMTECLLHVHNHKLQVRVHGGMKIKVLKLRKYFYGKKLN